MIGVPNGIAPPFILHLQEPMTQPGEMEKPPAVERSVVPWTNVENPYLQLEAISSDDQIILRVTAICKW